MTQLFLQITCYKNLYLESLLEFLKMNQHKNYFKVIVTLEFRILLNIL